MKLVFNKELDLSFLKENLQTKDEIKFVNPAAHFPFEDEYWLNFFKVGQRSESIFLYDHEKVAHAALSYREGIKTFNSSNLSYTFQY